MALQPARSSRPLTSVLCSLALLLSGLSASAAPRSADSDSDRAERSRLADERLPSAPTTNLEDLSSRLSVLGASAGGVLDLEAALRGDPGQSELDALVGALGLAEGMEAKAQSLIQAYRSDRPVALLGLDLSVEDQLFVGELLRLGLDPGAAAWLTMEARQSGWPESPAERELLRPLVRRTASEPDLQDAVLDAALLRREAATLLSGDEKRRLLSPGFESGETPTPAAAVCRDCPSWNYGLFLPVDAWQTHSGSIESGECKVYRFAVTAGGAYQYSFCEGGGSAGFDSLLVGKDVTCTEQGRNDDSCGTASDLTVTSPFTGYFYVQVSANAGDAGEYTLAFRKVGATPTAGCSTCPTVDESPGPPLPAWQTVDSTIGSEGCRLFEFPVRLGLTYRFTTCEPDSGGSTTFDTVIETAIASQTCRPGPGNDDACPDGGSTIEVTPSFSQALSIKVSGVNPDEWGDFTLAFREVSGECQDCPDSTLSPLSPDETLQFFEGVIPSGAGCDLIPVMVESGKSYSFSACELDGGMTSFTPDVMILDGACAPLPGVTTTACMAPELGSSWTFQPCYTGLVYIRVANADGPVSGAYRLAYTEVCTWVPGCRECIAPYGPFVPTTAWQTVPAYLPASGCRVFAFDLEAYRTYRFSGCQGGGFIGAGQSVRFRVRQSDCSACNPNSIGQCGGNQPRFDYTPEVSGTYYLVIEETFDVSGDVAVAFQERRVNCNNTDTSDTILPGVPGTTAVETLTVQTGARLHEFFVTPGETYRFTLCPMDSTGVVSTGVVDPALDWMMVVMAGGPNPCAPDATQVLTLDDCPGELDVVAPADGRIVIKVTRRCGSPGGDYEMDFRNVTTRVVFATSGRYRGDLDGMNGPAGGDAICRFLASSPSAAPSVQAAVAAGSTFVAWLSDSTIPIGAYDRLLAAGPVPAGVGYELPDGTPVASSPMGLIDPGDLLNPIDQTETGATVTANFGAWSGTDEWGDPTGFDCTAWSVAFPTEDGTSGRADRVDGTWSDNLFRPCDRRRRLYCFESAP